MPSINLSSDLKAQLIGWLHREKDSLLSIVAIAERIVIPGVTGTLDLARTDLDFVMRVRSAIRGMDTPVDLSPQDLETLLDIARSNVFPERAGFWTEVVRQLEVYTPKD